MAKWLGVVLFVVGLGLGVLLGRTVLAPSAQSSSPVQQNERVNRETFEKIKPEMSSWDLMDLLGAGKIIAEESLVVDKNGRFRKLVRQGDRSEETSGSVNNHDGKESKYFKQDIRWVNGQKSITVTVENGRVVSKTEQGL